MTYNVFGGTLNRTQSINQPLTINTKTTEIIYRNLRCFSINCQQLGFVSNDGVYSGVYVVVVVHYASQD